MYVDIQARDFSLTGSILNEVERSISDPLIHRYDRISQITVRLTDLNGPRGGNDKCCRVRVKIPGENDVFIEDVKSDLYAAISRAGQRALRSVARRFERRANHKQHRVYRNKNWNALQSA